MRDTANEINSMICSSYLPTGNSDNDLMISSAVDCINYEIINDNHDTDQFRFLTNLPKKNYTSKKVYNNKLSEHGICNGTIGVIIKIIDQDNIEVIFPTNTSITKNNLLKKINFIYKSVCHTCHSPLVYYYYFFYTSRMCNQNRHTQQWKKRFMQQF